MSVDNVTYKDKIDSIFRTLAPNLLDKAKNYLSFVQQRGEVCMIAESSESSKEEVLWPMNLKSNS